jgi:hypothetical protein
VATLGARDRAILTKEHRAIRRGPLRKKKGEESAPKLYEEPLELDDATLAAEGAEPASIEALAAYAQETERVEALARTEAEQTYIAFLAEGHKPAKAARLAGLTRGNRRSLERRVRKALKS